jgi:hypothetical protein
MFVSPILRVRVQADRLLRLVDTAPANRSEAGKVGRRIGCRIGASRLFLFGDLDYVRPGCHTPALGILECRQRPEGIGIPTTPS